MNATETPAPSEDPDVLVAGAGVGGICAAIGAARAGARVLLVEAAAEIGGTGVHSPVSLVCRFWDDDREPINRGLHAELFPDVYPENGGAPWDRVPTYDEVELARRYRELLAAEPNLAVLTNAAVTAVERSGSRVAAVELSDGKRVRAAVFVDSTADGNLSALAGAETELGREVDGQTQPATFTFKVSGVDLDRLRDPDIGSWAGIRSLRAELLPLYLDLKRSGGTTNPRDNVLCFPYPDGRALLFNQTRVLGADPTNAASMDAALAEGRRQATEFFESIRHHPAFTNATMDFVATRMGVREGRRVIGDYVLTAEDCLSARKFPDMVAACAYHLDIHDPAGAGTRMEHIAPPGYFHVPYRSLRARGFDNLLLGSRCISGSHEAHSAYRVMAPLSAIGQAAGVAAALAATRAAGGSRGIEAREIRDVLREQRQFVESEAGR